MSCQTSYLQSYTAGTRWKLAFTAATTAAACYLFCIVIFGYIYSDDMDQFFGILFHIVTLMGILIIVPVASVIGFSLASKQLNCVNIAKDINSIPLVQASMEECRLNPAACSVKA